VYACFSIIISGNRYTKTHPPPIQSLNECCSAPTHLDEGVIVSFSHLLHFSPVWSRIRDTWCSTFHFVFYCPMETCRSYLLFIIETWWSTQNYDGSMSLMRCQERPLGWVQVQDMPRASTRRWGGILYWNVIGRPSCTLRATEGRLYYYKQQHTGQRKGTRQRYAWWQCLECV
jgi:hypothetical protein